MREPSVLFSASTDVARACAEPPTDQPGRTRFLYGDLSEFPLGFDLLSAVKALVYLAAKLSELRSREEALEAALVRARDKAEAQRQSLDDFVGSLSRATEEARRRAGDGALVRECADQLMAAMSSTLLEVRHRHERGLASELSQGRSRLQAVATSTRELVHRYLTRVQLDSEPVRTSIRLDRGCYRFGVTARVPGDIEVAYSMDGEDPWARPLSVREILGSELMLQVGLRKTLLRRSLAPVHMQVSDHYLRSASLTPDRAEIHLSRRPDPGDIAETVLLVVEQGPGGLSAQVEMDGTEPAELPPDGEDLRHVGQLCHVLYHSSLASLADHPRTVESVWIDGRDACEEERPLLLVDRLVEHYAPFVAEIAARSPSRSELTLKVDRGNGVRAERYVRRDELLAPLGGLDTRASRRLRQALGG